MPSQPSPLTSPSNVLQPGTGDTTNLHAPTPALAIQPVGTTTVLPERFRIDEVHASGGLGTVSVATDLRLQRKVAFKRIRDDRDSAEARQRFLTEAAVTGRLEHPGIVPIYSLETDEEGRPGYAMRFIQGRSLADAIAAYHAAPTTLQFRDLLQRFITVCQTLAYAHSQGVIHRDLKPDNVMLGSYGETLVVDWGLAKQLGQHEVTPHGTTEPTAEPWQTVDFAPPQTPDLAPVVAAPHTQAGAIMGTPAYMAPEQARGEIEKLGPATDIYALGAMLFALLTGHAPYQGNLLDILTKLQGNPVPPTPEAVKTGIPRPLTAICVKAMAATPTARYATAADLAKEVERYLADEPVVAYSEPWTLRTRRWMRKNRTLVTAGMVLILTATIALLISLVLVDAERRKVIDQEKATALERDGKEKALQVALRQQQRAEKNQKKAMEQRDIAVAVRKFLQHDLLDQASAWQQAEALRNEGQTNQIATYEIKAGELLDRAARKLSEDNIEKKFPKQPLIQAELLTTLGEAYRAVGKKAKAIPFFQRALRLRLDHPNLGRLNKQTLESRVALAIAYIDAEKSLPAVTEFVELLQGVEDLLKGEQVTSQPSSATMEVNFDNDLESTDVKDVIGFILQKFEERLDPANGVIHDFVIIPSEQKQIVELMLKGFKLLNRIVPVVEARFGPDDERTWAARQMQAFALEAILSPDLAIPAYEKIVAAAERHWGEAHTRTLFLKSNLARAYSQANRHNDAIKLWLKTFELKRNILGADHPATLLSMRNIGMEYKELMMLDKALPILKESSERHLKQFGPDHAQTILSYNDLANGYLAANQFSKALEYYKKVLNYNRIVFGDKDRHTLVCQGTIAMTLEKLGKIEEALNYYYETLTKMESNFGHDHKDTITITHHYAHCLFIKKQYDKSITYYEKALSQRKKKLWGIVTTIL